MKIRNPFSLSFLSWSPLLIMNLWLLFLMWKNWLILCLIWILWVLLVRTVFWSLSQKLLEYYPLWFIRCCVSLLQDWLGSYFVNSTIISLILEKDNPICFSYFRPISLCKFLLKIFTKVLAERLGPILSKIISTQQGASTKDREISDNIDLTQEIIKRIDRKIRGGNIGFKLYMEKGYDRLE